MASGNKTVVTQTSPGRANLEGVISGSGVTPGLCMEIVATALVGGRATYRVYQPGSDGQHRAIIVCIENPFNGMQATDTYSSGDRGFFYCPLPGDELNMVIKDVAGTGDLHTIGDVMIVNSGTGKLIATTGSPGAEPFVLMQGESAPIADTKLLTFFTGT